MFKSPSTTNTRRFYNKLLDDKGGNLTFWGAEERFNPAKIFRSRSVHEHYERSIKEICDPEALALDIGCSTGGFTAILARYCKEVEGIDLSDAAVIAANQFFESENITNCGADHGDGMILDKPDGAYDVIQMIDVIHHAEDPKALLLEAHRLLRDDGQIVIFEPNKLNLLLWILCAIDKNEWGALKLGSIKNYHGLLKPLFEIERIRYNGLIIGPESKWAINLASYFSKPTTPRFLQTQSPKIEILAKKK